jgi:uncharacterized membrane protein YciS (DUF1049 family)
MKPRKFSLSTLLALLVAAGLCLLAAWDAGS